MGVHQNFSLSHKFEIQNEMQKKYEEIHCELDSVWYHEVKKARMPCKVVKSAHRHRRILS